MAKGHACNPSPWKVEAGESPVQAHQPHSGLESSLGYVRFCLNYKTKPTTIKPAERHMRASASISRWLQDDLFYTEMISPRNSHILFFSPRTRSRGLGTAGAWQLLSLINSDLLLGPTRQLKQGWGRHLRLHSVSVSFMAAQTPAWLCTDMLMSSYLT